MTQGAVMRSWRSAARNARVRQRPCGTLATSRAPRRQRPWRRVMLVLARACPRESGGLIDEHQALGVKSALIRLPPGPPAGDVAAILFAGVRLFFKRDPLVLEEAPHRPVACRRA